MSRRDGYDELRARLHAAAGAHEPDRARVLARVERGLAAHSPAGHRTTRRPVFGWLRVAGATAAVAGVLAAGGYAVASAVRGDTPARQTVSVPATRGPSPNAPALVAPSASGARDGPLRSDGAVDPGSNDFWAQSDVTLRAAGQLTALTVRLKVAQSGGVTSTGAWQSLPADDFTLTAAERDGFLVYTWVLKKGRTVPAGRWVFAGQYDHDRGGRDAGSDSYSATATADGRQRSVRGDFAR